MANKPPRHILGAVFPDQSRAESGRMLIQTRGGDTLSCVIGLGLKQTIDGIQAKINELPFDVRPIIEVIVQEYDQHGEFIITQLAYDPFAKVES